MNLYEEIAKMAHELYEKSGRVEGRDQENWLEAERIVKARQSEKSKGPAAQANKATPKKKSAGTTGVGKTAATKKPAAKKTKKTG